LNYLSVKLDAYGCEANHEFWFKNAGDSISRFTHAIYNNNPNRLLDDK
jgi:hypothetical protein